MWLLFASLLSKVARHLLQASSVLVFSTPAVDAPSIVGEIKGRLIVLEQAFQRRCFRGI
jgi:hypothetical protein